MYKTTNEEEINECIRQAAEGLVRGMVDTLALLEIPNGHVLLQVATIIVCEAVDAMAKDGIGKDAALEGLFDGITEVYDTSKEIHRRKMV